MKQLIFLTALTLFLGGCSLTKEGAQAPATPADTQKKEAVVQEPTPAPEFEVESSGDIDTDIEAIEAEFEELNVSADFQTFTEADLNAE